MWSRAKDNTTGEFIVCSGRTLSVTVLERSGCKENGRGAVHLEAKRTAFSGWGAIVPYKFAPSIWQAKPDRLEAKQELQMSMTDILHH
ncbi:MAG: hypothetical protein HKN76_20680 [Saprospiraceae bacterium]|nr:hypothetical protein [Saprospiraceae bacterium]